MTGQAASRKTVEDCTAPDPEKVKACESIWYVSGEGPQKAVTMKAPEGEEVFIQILRTGYRMDVPAASIRHRDTRGSEPIEPSAEAE